VLLHEVLELAAATAPDRTALVDGGRRVTFAELDDLVARTAAGLARLAPPGDHVGIVADNSLDFVVALYAAPRAALVLVPGNTRLRAADLVEQLEGCGATVVLGDRSSLDRLDAEPGRRDWRTVELGDRDLVAPDRSGPAVRDATAPAWCIHTSGTTGRPKGSVLTHASLLAAATNTALGRGVADDDVYLFPFPLFHVAAYNVVVHHLCRRPVVLLPRFDAAAVQAATAAEGVTSMSLAPTMLAMLLDDPGRDDAALRTLRRISYGASAMPLDLLLRVQRELPDVGLAQGYGMTELSGNAVFLGPDEHRRAAAGEADLLAAAGRPGPLAAVRIADPGGAPLPAGEVGEILVRGDQVHAGYRADPAATAAARHGPWLRTGDVGRLDAAGHLHVVDRLKDIIITGGENVASRAVEDVLSTHPDVAAVAVVGEPDERWGERVTAVVVWRAGTRDDDDTRAAALLGWSRDRLAGFQRPRSVRTVDALPTNASGKVDKRALRNG
jgi:acyl-CoA synthetase (AMP-forming)/AMP-acid ligase II